MIALALSPHLDDAAFSCGGTLARLAETGWRVVVATLFTRSVPDPTGFALACQLDKGLGPEVDYMALRRAEDRDAMRGFGAEARWLDLPEAPHRRYGSPAELFAETRPDDEAIVAEIAERVARLVAEVAPDLILGPQAIGRHVDHVQLVRALDRLPPVCPTLWWRDFPYTAREARPREPFADRMHALPAVEVALDPAHAAAKRAACLAYRSQLGFQFGGEAGLDAKLAEAGTTERFRVQGNPTFVIPGLAGGENPEPTTGWNAECATLQ